MKSKGRNSILKKIIGTLCIPVVTLLVMIQMEALIVQDWVKHPNVK